MAEESRPDEQLTDGLPQDIWYIAIPKEGTPGRTRRRKGVDKWRWSCPPEASVYIRESAQRLNPSIRRGAPFLFCNDVELYPEAVPAHELREEVEQQLAVPTPPPAQPPDDEHLALLEVKIREANLQLARIGLMADAEQRRLDSLQQDIKARQDEREREVKRSLEIAHTVQTGLLKDLDELQTHINKRRADAMQIEGQTDTVIKGAITGFATTSTELLNLRTNLLSNLGTDRFAEILKMGREIAGDLAKSNIVQMATVAVNSKIAASISEKLGREVDPEAVLRAHVLTGEHFLKRRAWLMTLIASHPAHVASTLIQLTINFEDGHVTAEQLASVFQ